MAGLYIHIPFCASRCIYCGFYSTTLPQLQDRYVEAVCREMLLRGERREERGERNAFMDESISSSKTLNPQSSKKDTSLSPLLSPLSSNSPTVGQEGLSTIYLGGGTPSQLSAENLRKIFLYINKVYGTDFKEAEDGSEMEITMECNPDDITPEFCETLRTLPVNRISMGAQTFSDSRLRFLRRRHTADEVRTAVDRLRKIGIGNISIDLMFGFPGETLEEWKSDIRECLALDVEHISAYSLMYEEGTSLYKMLVEEKIKEIDEELSLQMYETLIDMLTAAGFEHYEISNFAKLPNKQVSSLKGISLSSLPSPLSSKAISFRSRHNSSYWHGTPYIGIGAAAHSFDTVSRRWNVADIKTYIESIERGEQPYEREVLDTDTRYNETVMTGLRTCEGVDLKYISDSFGAKYGRHLLSNAQKNISLGNLIVEDNRLRLTRKGIYTSDGITAELFV